MRQEQLERCHRRHSRCGLGVSPVPRPRPDNLVMGTSPIGPTVTVSTKDALLTTIQQQTPFNTQTFGALPDGVTQQMITDSQNDGEYGYYNNDGSFVPANIDKYNGGGPDYSGVRIASGGGAQFDKDGDRFITKEEMGIGEAAGKELDQRISGQKLGRVLAAHRLALVKIQRVLPNGLKNFLFLADLPSEN
jgi:hypothetical protein